MVSRSQLVRAVVATLQQVPPLVSALGGAANILAYIDVNPTSNSRALAVYSQKPSTVLVIWEETVITEGEIEAWEHTVRIYIRPPRDGSAMDIGDLIVNGIEVPGDGCQLPWRYCPVMSGLLPATMPELGWETDSEQIDYAFITVKFKESGDTFNVIDHRTA